MFNSDYMLMLAVLKSLSWPSILCSDIFFLAKMVPSIRKWDKMENVEPVESN